MNNEAAERRLKEIPRKYRPLYIRAVEGTASPREAIRAMCHACMGWEGDWAKSQTLSQATEECTSQACPLWQYRPRIRPCSPRSSDSEAVQSQG